MVDKEDRTMTRLEAQLIYDEIRLSKKICMPECKREIPAIFDDVTSSNYRRIKAKCSACLHSKKDPEGRFLCILTYGSLEAQKRAVYGELGLVLAFHYPFLIKYKRKQFRDF